MHSSGPRPKLHSGSPTSMSSPTLLGAPQFRCAVAFVELPDGWHTTASCWPFGFPAGVLPLLYVTTRSPFGMTTGSEPWSRLQACGSSDGSNTLPKKHSELELPLICSGVDQVRAPSVDIEP